MQTAVSCGSSSGCEPRAQTSRRAIRQAFRAALLMLASAGGAAAADTPPAPPSPGWSGSGEAGLAVATGNTRSENLNAKAVIKYNDANWKNEMSASTVRTKTSVTTTVNDTSTTPPTVVSKTHDQLTADRIEAAGSAGYKLDERSYLVGAWRYEHDDFSPYRQQSMTSLGYGYQVLRSAQDEFAFEIGGGYKSVEASTTSAAKAMHVSASSLTGTAARGKFEYKYNFNAVTSFTNTCLVESTSGNTFVQNDAGLQVKMTHSLGLKAGYEVRHNSDMLLGFKSTDQLLTTNLVYSF